METIRLLIADDHAVVRDGLMGILSRQRDFDVVGEAATGLEAVERARELQPDVVLMDIRMPGMDGVEAMRLIRDEDPQVEFIVLTTYDNDEYIFSAIEAGAKGYVLKDSPRERLFQALRAVYRGESFVDPSVSARVLNRLAQLSRKATSANTGMLSHREVEVLRLMATGATNREIAAALSITEGTAKTHAAKIFQKLEVKDRTEAVTKAVQQGVIEL